MAAVRIVIVDDYEAWRSSIRLILWEDQDLEIVGECSDGLEAVHKSKELQPDLILLDIVLPTLNGLEAARRIHEVSPASKILFVSSYHHPDVMREALRVGAAYVVKADAARDLLPAVRATMRNEPFVRFRFLTDEPPTTTGL